MKIVNPELDVGKFFALIYGDSGTGKTHFAATLGELGKVLIIDPDGGYKTIVKAPDLLKNKKIQDNVTIVTFDAFKDLNGAYQLVEKNDPAAWTKAGIETTEPFDWVVWDTWSELQWVMMQELRKNEQLLSGNMGKDLNFRKNVGIQHWGMLTDLNKLAIEQLKACTKAGKCSQLFIMQEKVDKDEITGVVIKGPAIHGKMTKEMPAYFDVVIHTGATAQGQWFATTKPKMGWPAKTRLGEGKEVTNPKSVDFFGVGA